MIAGWSGAKLAQLLQESALMAIRNKHESILQSDMEDAIDRLTVGPKCVGIELGYQGQCRRATTEVGTAIISHLLRRYENAKVEKCERISLIPRGQVIIDRFTLIFFFLLVNIIHLLTLTFLFLTDIFTNYFYSA